ncbi:aerobic C4-dicarboxylate transport protein [Campylobacter jejuni subsp. doylei]|nr:aerobic C4-dicarboxylate transport protein [Campylobacter jejuni subsp. doylei]
MANVMQPGHGMNLDPSQLDTKSVQKYISQTIEGKTIQVLVIAIIYCFDYFFNENRIQTGNSNQRVFEVVQNFLFLKFYKSLCILALLPPFQQWLYS